MQDILCNRITGININIFERVELCLIDILGSIPVYHAKIAGSNLGVWCIFFFCFLSTVLALSSGPAKCQCCVTTVTVVVYYFCRNMHSTYSVFVFVLQICATPKDEGSGCVFSRMELC